MGRDHTTKQHARSSHRQAPKSDNVYLKMLVKLYAFLASKYPDAPNEKDVPAFGRVLNDLGTAARVDPRGGARIPAVLVTSVAGCH